eukprot:TRINITY_DN83169_c0_g1_i1.p1 TRINITY_DN83169_c0_g1~~TRINITY_DN83169_c0_g1_i1.p1  ORF type:complete len:380 (-),score=39.43 TRINITY_DN83169_c0_g1_i1:75-1214(-)
MVAVVPSPSPSGDTFPVPGRSPSLSTRAAVEVQPKWSALSKCALSHIISTRVVWKVTVSVLVYIALTLCKEWITHASSFASREAGSSVCTILGTVTGFLAVQWSVYSLNRWWEGRQYLAEVTHLLHSIAWNVALSGPKDELPKFQMLLQAYMPICLMALLPSGSRQGGIWLDDRTGVSVSARVLPDHLHSQLFSSSAQPRVILSLWMKAILKTWEMSKVINRLDVYEASNQLSQLDLAAKGCEKLVNTPMPALFQSIATISISIFTWIFLPVSLVMLSSQEEAGLEVRVNHSWSHGLMVAGTALIFWVIHTLGMELENPFGLQPHDLPVLPMTRKMDSDLDAIFSLSRKLPAEICPAWTEGIRTDGARARSNTSLSGGH